MRRIFIAGLLLTAAVLSAQTIKLTPQTLSPGSPVLIEITADATAIDGTLRDQPVRFFHGAGDHWYALAGIDVEAPVEPVKLALKVHLANGTSSELAREIPLTPAHYRTATISVAPKFVAPPPEAEKEIAEEKELKDKLFGEANSRADEQPMWSADFRVPVKSQATDSFGTRRVVRSNTDATQKIESIHKGMDFRAATGTPVHAANSGIVLLAQHLYFEGNCVILDHGFGLYTLYMHLSHIDVKAGERVTTGELLGLSGATGRVTGPHLHWAVRYQNIYLDPGKLLKIELPKP
jgi:murein DD-endopeptidase MepM/ murein hydrolase activator NlpD